MQYSIITSDTRAKTVIAKLIEKYPVLQTDKSINESSLSDLYIVDNNKKYYVNNGYSRLISNSKYVIAVEV